VANLLPGVIMSIKKLRAEPAKTSRKILIKFLRAVAYVVTAGTAPWVALCLFSRISPLHNVENWQNRMKALISVCCGVMFMLIEPIHKHQAYVGYLGPKAFDLLVGVLQSRRLMPQAFPFVTANMQILCCAMVGLAFSRGND